MKKTTSNGDQDQPLSRSMQQEQTHQEEPNTQDSKQDASKQTQTQQKASSQEAPNSESTTAFASFSEKIKQRTYKTLRSFLPSDPLQELHSVFEQLQTELPPPCILLLGEPQVGKSSVVRTLTHSTDVQIGLGDGIPVTEYIQAYPFPKNSEYPLWIFLDTPGVGTHTPNEEAVHQLQDSYAKENSQEHGLLLPKPHMILACIRVDDEELALLPWLETWSQPLDSHEAPLPLLVVQTCLHRVQHPHPEPYPFGDRGDELPDRLPESTRFMLHKQREQILALREDASFVIVDLTDPEDEVGDPLYGAEALFESVIAHLPQAVAQMLFEQRATFDKAFEDQAHRLIYRYSMLAAAAGALPPPLGDVATLSIALTLLKQLATQYRQPWELRTVLDLLWSLGSTTLVWLTARYLIRRIPIPVLMIPMGAAGAFSIVFSVGHLMAWYYSHVRLGHQPTEQDVLAHWKHIQEEAKTLWHQGASRLWDQEQTE